MKSWNKLRHDSNKTFFRNVVRFSFEGKTNFSRVFKYRAVPFTTYGHNVELRKSICIFFNMKVWNKDCHDSYTYFLKSVVKFLFAGKTNSSSAFKYGAVSSPPYGHNVDLSKNACLFSI